MCPNASRLTGVDGPNFLLVSECHVPTIFPKALGEGPERPD
jgi:hypothetical protein